MSDTTYQYKALNSAIYAFLSTYVIPEIDQLNIFAGDQQNMVLPEGEDYVVYHILSQIRHGTNSETYDPQNEELTLKELNEITVQVDCYADSTNSSDDDAILRAQIRANNLHMIARSSVAVEFFKPYGISALYAEDAVNSDITSDSNQYLHRWTVRLHLSMPATVTLPQPGFDRMPVIFNKLITQSEADADPIGSAKLHVADVDVWTKKS